MQFAAVDSKSNYVKVPALALTILLLQLAIVTGCTMARGEADAGDDGSGESAPKPASQLAPSAAPPVAETSGRGENSAGQTSPGAVATASPDDRASQAVETPSDEADGTAEPELTYRVQAGDTLSRIAERYDLSIGALLNVNDLPNPDFLEVGQIINLPQPPVDYTPAFRILPDSRLIRSIRAVDFDIEGFVTSQPGVLRRLTAMVPTRLADGTPRHDLLSGSQVIERVSREYRVDARLLLAFLEYFAGLVSDATVDDALLRYPLLAEETLVGRDREGLYNQVSWLADRLNQGYYDWKYRGKTILDAPDGGRRYFDPALNAGSIAVQYAIAQFRSVEQWEADVDENGLNDAYRRLFGDPFAGAFETVPANLSQPELTLPFPRGDIWRFTGGFHGGWGNGSAWAAIDFAPPDEEPSTWCYTSEYPVTAIARGIVAKMDAGRIVLDLDEDGNAGSGWAILYLHISPHDGLREGQLVNAGNILGYASCLGGFSTATHLHIARTYNGEWIPADCVRCPAGRAVPPFVMSNWKVVGLGNQLYQGFLVNTLDNRNVIAEQGRYTNVNVITW